MERQLEFQVSVPFTERIDRFLADQLSISRTQAARLVAGGAVLVNAEPVRASRSLARGDFVSVLLPAEAVGGPRELKPLSLSVNVVHEDESLVVLDKPAGLVVHPAPGHWEDTLLNALVARGTPLAADAAGRPGLVHRLDKDTSGLMVLAKTDAAHRKLGRAMAQRRVKRVYAALVWGHLGDVTEIDAPVARHPRDRKRMTVIATGRPARTLVEPVARFDVCDLVRVHLETGRTHQIRVHMNHVGHPVVGDPAYGGGGPRRVTGSQQARATLLDQNTPRQALHAARLDFLHPDTDVLCEFRSEWPVDLRAALQVANAEPHQLARDNWLEYLGFFK